MKNNQIIYINLKQAIELHNWIINNAGGSEKFNNCPKGRCFAPSPKDGLPQRGCAPDVASDRLENILQEIQRNDNYPEFKDKLTQLVFAIDKSKEDIPDSKRLSIALGCYFLELNGYDYVVHYFAEEMDNIVLWLEKRKINRQLLAEIIDSLIYEEDYSEELKLKIAIAISQ